MSTRHICHAYAEVLNLQKPLTSFEKLLHPHARWITKIGTFHGLPAISFRLQDDIVRNLFEGLRHVELISRYTLEDGFHVDCTITASVSDPAQYWCRTTFETAPNGRITKIFTYSEWLDPKWPYPERVIEQVSALRDQDIPIHAFPPKPPKLIDDFDEGVNQPFFSAPH